MLKEQPKWRAWFDYILDQTIIVMEPKLKTALIFPKMLTDLKQNLSFLNVSVTLYLLSQSATNMSAYARKRNISFQ